MPDAGPRESQSGNKTLLPPRVLARILSGTNKRGSATGPAASEPEDFHATPHGAPRAEHAKVLVASATAVSNVVNSLYKLGKDDRIASRKAKSKALLRKGDGGHLARSGTSASARASPKASAPKSDASESDDGADGADATGAMSGSEADDDNETSSEEAYDFKAAAAKVTMLLGSLNTERRVNILTDMGAWYESKEDWVEEETLALAEIEVDYNTRQEATRTGLQELQRAVEAKQLREARAVMDCQGTLTAGAENQLIRCPPARRRFSSESQGGSSICSSGHEAPDKTRRRARICSSATDGDDGDGGPRRLGVLGSRLRSQPTFRTRKAFLLQSQGPPADLSDHEAAKHRLKELAETQARAMSIIAQASPDDMPAAELFIALARVQNIQSDLEAGAELAHHRKATLAVALEHFNEPTEDTEETSPACLELISELSAQVSLEADLPKGPSPEELEEEDDELQEVMRKQKAKMDALNRNKRRQDLIEAELERDNLLEPEDEGPVTFLAVPSPVPESDPSTSAAGSRMVSKEVADAEDTIPPGTTRNVKQQLEALKEAALEQQAKVTEYVDVKLRMRMEQALLQYCTAKAEAGIASLVENYHPYDLIAHEARGEDKGGDGATDDLAQQDPSQPTLENVDEASTGRSQPQGQPMSAEAGTATASPDCSPKLTITFQSDVDDSLTADGSPRSQLSTPASPSSPSSPQRARSRSRALTEEEDMAEEAARQSATSERTVIKGAQSEEDMKKQMRELERAMSKHIHQLGLEKGRQTKLTEGISKLREQIALVAAKNRDVPKDLPSIERVTVGMKSEEREMEAKDRHLQEELTREKRLMDKAKSALMDKAQSSELHVHGLIPGIPAGPLDVAFSPGSTLLPPPAKSNPSATPASLVAVLDPEAGSEPVPRQTPPWARQRETPPPAVEPVGVARRPSLSVFVDPSQRQRELEQARRLSMVAREDLGDLVALQAKNMNLKADVSTLNIKMKALRNAMRGGKTSGITAQGLMLIIGVSKEESNLQPPPEHSQLRKDVREKQREVRDLRSRWWSDHRELEMFVERGRQQGYQLGHMSEMLELEQTKQSNLRERKSTILGVPPQQQLSLPSLEHSQRLSIPEEEEGAYGPSGGQIATEQEAMLAELQVTSGRTTLRGSDAQPRVSHSSLTVASPQEQPAAAPPVLPAARGSTFRVKRMSTLTGITDRPSLMITPAGRPSLGGSTRSPDASPISDMIAQRPEPPPARRGFALADPRARFNSVRKTIVANDGSRVAQTLADMLQTDAPPVLATLSESSGSSSEASAT